MMLAAVHWWGWLIIAATFGAWFTMLRFSFDDDGHRIFGPDAKRRKRLARIEHLERELLPPLTGPRTASNKGDPPCGPTES